MQTLKTSSDKSALVFLLKTNFSQNPQVKKDKAGIKSIPLERIPQLKTLEEPLNTSKTRTRFLIHTRADTKVILFDEVVCCIADSNYTLIYLSDGSKVMVSKTLKEVETILFPPNFIRIHASNLINLHFIKRILLNHQCKVELPNHIMLDVSRSRRDELMQKMKTL